MNPQPLLDMLGDLGLRPQEVWLTHGHGDHIAGIAALSETFPELQLVCPAGDAHMLIDAMANLSAPFGFSITSQPADCLVEPGASLTVGSSQWLVIDSSGHTRGSVSYYNSEAATVITGDALFAGSIGRTDIPGGSAARLLRNIRANLLPLAGDTAVLPGHGESSTIGKEKKSNPFLIA